MSEKKSNTAATSGGALAVHAWLQRYELDTYSDRLTEVGYSSMRFLQAASEEDIKEAIRDISMKKGHAKVFMLAWTELVAKQDTGASISTQRLQKAQSVPTPGKMEAKDAKAKREATVEVQAQAQREAEMQMVQMQMLRPVTPVARQPAPANNGPDFRGDPTLAGEVECLVPALHQQTQTRREEETQMMQMQMMRQVAPRQLNTVINDAGLTPAPDWRKWVVRMESGDSPIGYATFATDTLLQTVRVALLQGHEMVRHLPSEWVFVKNAAPVAKKAEGKWRLCDLGDEIVVRAKLKPAAARGGGEASQSPSRHHCWQAQAGTTSLWPAAPAEQAAAARAQASAALPLPPGTQSDLSSKMGRSPQRQHSPSGGSLPPWRWKNTPENSDAIYDLYCMIDKNESGGISSTELTHMLLNLGEDVSEALVEDMITMVDKNGDREISFAEFRAILFGAQPFVDSSGQEGGEVLPEQMTERDTIFIKQKFGKLTHSGDGEYGGSILHKPSNSVGSPVRYRNDEVRYLFTQMDEDGSGYLDQAEVAKLAVKLGHAIRPRDLVGVMKTMDPGGTGKVTFERFRDWLLDTRYQWSDMIVLPEGSVAAVRQKAEQLDLLPDLSDTTVEGDPAAIEWQRLSVLLKLMHSATVLWGKPTEMYGLHVIELERKIIELTAFVEQHQSTTSGANEQHEARRKLRALIKELKNISPRSELLSSNTTRAAENSSTGALSAADIEKEATVRRCFFTPQSAFRVVWDLVQVFLLLYLLIVLPVRLSFGIDVPFNSFGFWFDVCVDVYFFCDIFINFRTAFYDQRGVLVINQAELTRNYLRSWFLIDFGTCIPISYIMMVLHGVDSSTDGKQIRMLKILRLMKLAKLLRVSRILRMLERYREYLVVFYSAFGSILLGVLIIITTHIFACIWYFIGTYEQAPSWGAVEGVDRTPGYDGWVFRTYGLGCDPNTGLAVSAEEHWQASVDPRLLDSDEGPDTKDAAVCVAESVGSRYATSMYWALMTISTVGYGDYTAQTNAEKFWCMFAMLVGSLVFATITGSLSARMMASKGAVQQFNTKMDEVRNYLADNGLPVGQRRMIEAHYAMLWHSKSIYSEKEILERLPTSLSTSVVQFLYEDVMGSAAIFTQLMDPALPHGREILAKIAMELMHEVANAGVVVMQEGQYGSKMYLIADGEVEIFRWFDSTAPTARLSQGERRQMHRNTRVAQKELLAGSRIRLGRLGPRAFFGERSVMRVDESPTAKVINIRTAVARSACNFYALSKCSLEQLREEYAALNQCMLRIEGSLITEFDLEAPSCSPRSPLTGGGRVGSALNGFGGDGSDASWRNLEARMGNVEMQVTELKAETGSKLDALMAIMVEMQASTVAIQSTTTNIEDSVIDHFGNSTRGFESMSEIGDEHDEKRLDEHDSRR